MRPVDGSIPGRLALEREGAADGGAPNQPQDLAHPAHQRGRDAKRGRARERRTDYDECAFLDSDSRGHEENAHPEKLGARFDDPGIGHGDGMAEERIVT